MSIKVAVKENTKTLLRTSIIAELELSVPGKITKVRSCSDCCMLYNPDRTPNTVGAAFQKEHTVTVTNLHGTYSYLDCKNCPIHINTTDEEWAQILADIDGEA